MKLINDFSDNFNWLKNMDMTFFPQIRLTSCPIPQLALLGGRGLISQNLLLYWVLFKRGLVFEIGAYLRTYSMATVQFLNLFIEGPIPIYS